MLDVSRRLGQQLLRLMPIERLVVDFGFMTALFQRLVQVKLFIGHEMQAITGEEPQQVARYQMGDLWVALNDLADQVLAQVLALQGILRQQGEQLVEALEKQRVAFLRDLFGLT